jgi:medium-chain acyl-[acyl-carrier-protein] hydrolase
MYHAMAAALPADWELLILDLPGRGKRHAEPLIRDMATLIDRVVDDVKPLLDAPVALFGHSLGGILAAEVGRRCEQLGTPPVWVGISGRIAPAFQAMAPKLSALSDDALLGELISLGATPDRIQHMPELRDRLMRIVRADIALLESYHPATDRAPLGCAVTMFAGDGDIWAPPSAMLAWAAETRGEFTQRVYPGNHFYFLGAGFAPLTRDLVADIAHYAPRGAAEIRAAG